jgi:hypothetical protein
MAHVDKTAFEARTVVESLQRTEGLGIEGLGIAVVKQPSTNRDTLALRVYVGQEETIPPSFASHIQEALGRQGLQHINIDYRHSGSVGAY